MSHRSTPPTDEPAKNILLSGLNARPSAPVSGGSFPTIRCVATAQITAPGIDEDWPKGLSDIASSLPFALKAAPDSTLLSLLLTRKGASLASSPPVRDVPQVDVV